MTKRKIICKSVDIDKVISEITKNIENNTNNKKSGKQNWLTQLLDKDNNKVSSSSFYLVSVTIVGLLLLLVPLFVLLIEVWHNHTISTDLNGMSAYIASVASLFATGGIVKGWVSYNDSKNTIAKIQHDSNCEYVEDDEDDINCNSNSTIMNDENKTEN